MAKKRKGNKKHSFSPQNLGANPVVNARPEGQGSTPLPASAAAMSVGFATAQVVRRDVGRVLLLAAVFIVLMVALWAVFTHTGLGQAIYNSVKI